MGRCACGDRCVGPTLSTTQHHCPGCKGPMHAICGIHDDNRGVHDFNWCFTCHELTGGNVTAIETTTTKQTNPTQQANKNNKAKKKPRTASRSVPNPTTRTLRSDSPTKRLRSATSNPPRHPTNHPIKPQRKSKSSQSSSKHHGSKSTQTPSKAAPRKTAPTANKKRKPENDANNKTSSNKPTKKAKGTAKTKPPKIVAAVPNKNDDPLLYRDIAFHLKGPEKPEWLDTNSCMKYGRKYGDKMYIFGIIVRQEDKQKRLYTIEWENTLLGTTKLDVSLLFGAMELATKLVGKYGTDKKDDLTLGKRVIQTLTQVTDDHEKGDVIDSDTDEETDDEKIVNDDEYTISMKPRATCNELLDFPSQQEQQPQDEDLETTGLKWRYNGRMNPPINVSRGVTTQLKRDAKLKFVNPLASFLAFLPIEFWKRYCYQTNCYTREKYNKQRDRRTVLEHRPRNWVDLTLNEFMTFVSILIKITLRPTPGQRYTDAWKNMQWHPYCAWMTKQRMVEIRSVLHMSEVGTAEQKSRDSLFKLRPILNVLKKTLGAYLNVGSEVTLDESSIACRSTYGRSLIFYNNTKPSGKYHFRIYVVCDADNYAALRFRVHTKDGSDFGDGGVETRTTSTEVQFRDEDNHNNTDDDPYGSTIQKLVLDMMKLFFMSGKVMNCDNYYTSPETFIELQKNGVFARGTCRPSRKMFPLCVQYVRT